METFLGDADFSFPDLDKLTAQALKLSLNAITLRDLFRVLWVKYCLLPPHAKVAPHSLIESLKMFYPYRRRSFYQLRHFIRKVCEDKRSEVLLETRVNPPVDRSLASELKEALPGLKEVIVIPDISRVDPLVLNFYLGLITAQIFGPRLADGARIGIGGGHSIFFFAKALPHFVKASNLRFYVLSRYKGALVSFADAEKIISEMIVDYKWKQLRDVDKEGIEGIISLRDIKGSDLDWAFVEIGDPREGETFNESRSDVAPVSKAGAVAELLFHFFATDGTIITFPKGNLGIFEAVPLSVLREMTRMGRQVVALAGGEEKVPAVLAVYKTSRYGGHLFNCLVTDESCAIGLLKSTRPTKRLSQIPNRSEWWEEKNRFLAAHLKHVSKLSNTEISNSLGIPRKKVRQWLKEASEGKDNCPPLLSFFVRTPSPEFSLEIALIRRYKLLDARVVPHFADRQEQLSQLGLAAAQFFCEILCDRDVLRVGIGSGYEVRAMIESLSLPGILHRFRKLKRLEFWGLSESRMITVTRGLSTQSILSSIVLRCSISPVKAKIYCYPFDPSLPYLNLDAAFFTVRQPYEGDPIFLDSVGMKCLKYVEGKELSSFMLNQFLNGQGEPVLPESEAMCVSVTTFRDLVKREIPVVALNARAFEEVEPHARALKIACVNNLVNCLVISRPIAEALLRK